MDFGNLIIVIIVSIVIYLIKKEKIWKRIWKRR